LTKKISSIGSWFPIEDYIEARKSELPMPKDKRDKKLSESVSLQLETLAGYIPLFTCNGIYKKKQTVGHCEKFSQLK